MSRRMNGIVQGIALLTCFAAPIALAGTAEPLGPLFGTSSLTYTPFSQNMSYSGNSPWVDLISAATYVSSDSHVTHEPYMSLGNALVRADLQQTVGREFSLSFRSIHSAYSRNHWVGLFDEEGKRGFVLYWASALSTQYGGNGYLRIYKFDLSQSLDTYSSWSSLPTGTQLGSTVNSGHHAVYESGYYNFAKFQLNWDAATNQLTVTVDGNEMPVLTVTDSGSWNGGWIPSFRRIYVKGNSDTYLDDVSVTVGRYLQYIDGRTYVDERFNGSQRAGAFSTDIYSQVDQPWYALTSGASIYDDLFRPGVTQLTEINVNEQGSNANRELRLRFTSANARAATPIAVPLPDTAAEPIIFVSYDVRRETGNITGGAFLVNSSSANGSNASGVGFLTELSSTNTIRLRVTTTNDSGSTKTTLAYVTVTTAQPTTNRVFPVTFMWNRATGDVSAAVDGGSLQTVSLTTQQKSDLVSRAAFTHAVLHASGTNLRLDNVLVTGAPPQYVTATSNLSSSISSAAGTSHKTLLLLPGTYTHSGTLDLNGVRLIGTGTATRIVASNPNSASLSLLGTRPAVRRITHYSSVPDADYNTFAARKASRTAGGSDANNIRLYAAQNALVTDVVVERSRGVGIKTQALSANPSNVPRYIDIVANTVFGTMADGIHNIHGTRDARVFNNHVQFTGDDMISVVSQRESSGTSFLITRDVQVFQNNCNYQFWGRGITIIGGQNVSLENNRVHGSKGSIVKVVAESGYDAYAITDALVRYNHLTTARCAAEVLNHPGQPDDGMSDPNYINQGAIEIGGYSGYSVVNPRIENNILSDTAWHGIFAKPYTQNLKVLDNDLDTIITSGQAQGKVMRIVDFTGTTSVTIVGNILHSSIAGGSPAWFIYNENPLAETNPGYNNIFTENYTDGPNLISHQEGLTDTAH